MKKILIAPNSFKGTADAVEVSELFDKHLDKSLFEVIQKPISDGGDGFLEVSRLHFGLETINYSITSPFDETYMDCNTGLDRINKTMYIESAEVLGLKRIPEVKRNPLILSSKGLGDLLQAIVRDLEELKFELEKVIIGIGGTGTMDMGMGLCSRLGMRFFDISGNEIEVLPENFQKVDEIEFDKPEVPFKFEIILDVQNHLLGEGGGIVYGSQKGASDTDLKIIESGWSNIVKKLKNNSLLETSKELSGAGGGLPVGLSLISETIEKHAGDFITADLKINDNTSDIDMVITGEGSFDEQSLMGKGAGIIINLFEEKNIPVALCCGKIDSKVSEKLSMNVFPMELQTYTDDPIKNFEEAIKIACDEISGMTDILTKIS
jgi:glycerate 2-kinase